MKHGSFHVFLPKWGKKVPLIFMFFFNLLYHERKRDTLFIHKHGPVSIY